MFLTNLKGDYCAIICHMLFKWIKHIKMCCIYFIMYTSFFRMPPRVQNNVEYQQFSQAKKLFVCNPRLQSCSLRSLVSHRAQGMGGVSKMVTKLKTKYTVNEFRKVGGAWQTLHWTPSKSWITFPLATFRLQTNSFSAGVNKLKSFLFWTLWDILKNNVYIIIK